MPIDFNLPIYLESFEYSVENNEVEIYHASGDINRACAKAIDTAIHDSEHERYFYSLDEALKTVTEQFGSERVNAVLANTIKHYEYDGRISQKNKYWAREIETPQDKYLLLQRVCE